MLPCVARWWTLSIGATAWLASRDREVWDAPPSFCSTPKRTLTYAFISAYTSISIAFTFKHMVLSTFFGRFMAEGGQVLLIDQAFKLPEWREQLCECYHKYPYLRIVYTTTSVNADEEEDTSELASISRVYVLHGFSFREYINLQTNQEFDAYTFDQLLADHDQILKTILPKVQPWHYFQDYLQHGYYPSSLKIITSSRPCSRRWIIW